jgi:exosortase D (VPLPA-CTERM-specific)
MVKGGVAGAPLLRAPARESNQRRAARFVSGRGAVYAGASRDEFKGRGPVTTRSQRMEGAVGARGRGLSLGGLFWLGLAVLGTLPLFRLGFEGLAEAWARPEFSHGPVIPVLSFYMFLRELKAVPPVPEPVAGRWPGVALVGLALLVAVAGNLAGIDHLVFYALIVWVAGLVLTGFGWTRGKAFWPSVLHLVFMLPLPQFLYWKLSTALQLVSSAVGVELVRAAGVPVFLDGNVIDLGIYKLQVAEACSGLRYLFPIMSFTYVFAVLYRGPVWHKLVLLFSAVPLAIAMNAVRIGVIGILVDRHGIAQAEGFLHAFEGWVIFLACIAILFGMAKAMQRLSGDRRPLGEALELDFSGLGHQLARVRGVAPSRALVAAACLTLMISAAWLAAPPRAAATPEREPFALFPAELGGWSGVQGALAPDVEATLGADDYLSAWFASPDAAEGVDLFLSFYAVQTDGEAIHSPEVCLPGAGWEVSAIRSVPVELPGTALGRIEVNRAVIQKGLERQLVWYWFEGRGQQFTGDFGMKFANIADSVREGRTDGGLVRLVTPVGEDGVAGAEARLTRFLAATVDTLPRFIPD